MAEKQEMELEVVEAQRGTPILDVKDEYYSDAQVITLNRFTVNVFFGRLRYSHDGAKQTENQHMERAILLSRESAVALHQALGQAIAAFPKTEPKSAK